MKVEQSFEMTIIIHNAAGFSDFGALLNARLGSVLANKARPIGHREFTYVALHYAFSGAWQTVIGGFIVYTADVSQSAACLLQDTKDAWSMLEARGQAAILKSSEWARSAPMLSRALYVSGRYPAQGELLL